MRAILGAMMLCSCGSPPSSLDSGYALRSLDWAEVDVPWESPDVFVVASDRGQNTVFAANYEPDAQGYSLEVASWDSANGIGIARQLQRFPSRYVPKLSWNGALLLDYSEFGGDQSITHVALAPYRISSHVFTSAYSDRPKIKAGAAGDGLAWLVRNVPYKDDSRMACANRTVELFGLREDGGTTGLLCPFEDRYRDAGSDFSISNSFGLPFDIHPSRRLLSRGECPFLAFDLQGQMSACAYMPGSEGQLRRFWPTDDDPPRIILEDLKQDILTRSFRVDDIFEWRWVDGGVEQARSVLAGEIQFIERMTKTSRGVVVTGYAPVPSKDGGAWVPNSFARSRPRILLVSTDGSRVLGGLDLVFAAEDKARLTPKYIGEDQGQIFAFDEKAQASDFKLFVAPLKL